MHVANKPLLKPIISQHIPHEMKISNQWVNWAPGNIDPNGKFPKYPIDAEKGFKINAHDPKNHLSFMSAYANSLLSDSTGIGYVLNGQPLIISKSGLPLYLIGIDIDAKSNLSANELHETWTALGKPYVEISPSKTGIRMFCLSKTPLKNKNKDGLEIYSDKRFLTVTGWSAKGTLCDSSEAVRQIHEKWFSESNRFNNSIKGGLAYPVPDTPRKRALVNELLNNIDPDCDYETYRNVIWALEATQWHDRYLIQKNWSNGAPERFSEDCLTIIKSSFDFRTNGITFGSLTHYSNLGKSNKSKGAL